MLLFLDKMGEQNALQTDNGSDNVTLTGGDVKAQSDRVTTSDALDTITVDDSIVRAIREYKWCERGESNPHTLGYWILNPARLPIPPLSQVVGCEGIEPPAR